MVAVVSEQTQQEQGTASVAMGSEDDLRAALSVGREVTFLRHQPYFWINNNTQCNRRQNALSSSLLEELRGERFFIAFFAN